MRYDSDYAFNKSPPKMFRNIRLININIFLIITFIYYVIFLALFGTLLNSLRHKWLRWNTNDFADDMLFHYFNWNVLFSIPYTIILETNIK